VGGNAATAGLARALTPGHLAADFGAGAPATRRAVRALYRALDEQRHGLPRTRYRRWASFFGDVSGYDEQALARKAKLGDFARRLAGPGGPGEVDAPRFLFALHTYFAFLAKAIAARVLEQHQPRRGTAHPPRALARAGSNGGGSGLRDALARMEDGGLFRDLGVSNLPDDDFFGWYVHVWTPDLAGALGPVLTRLAGYDPAGHDPPAARDLLKGLYQSLLPRELRHDLGEYYTPDWLADWLLARLGEPLFVMPGGTARQIGSFERRLLDPACGSGTFLVTAIRSIREHARGAGLPAGRTLELILRNVAGIDLNPLAVLAARVNYLLAIADLIPAGSGGVTIPVYRGDSILTPALPAAPGMTRPPDAAAPLSAGTFDYVVGNPPWVNWESLPGRYRQRTACLWDSYGLFVHRGMDTILGKSRKDIATLLTYVAADRYLADGGTLGFVITQSVFKTSGAAQGFRRFTLPDGRPLRVIRVDDLSELRPFGGSANRAAVLIVQKGRPTTYPVPYTYWRGTPGAPRPGHGGTRGPAAAMTRGLDLAAEPVDAGDVTSAWLTARPETLTALRRILGQSGYVAREGVNTGGANAVFWLDVHEKRAGTTLVSNITEGAKREADRVTAEIESGLVFPLLRPRDLVRWRAVPSAHILLTQDPVTRRGIAEATMTRHYPRALGYVRRFEPQLRARAAFRRYYTRPAGGGRTETGAFYSMFNVGVYTMCRHKVVWARLGADLAAAAVTEVMLPQETMTFIPAGTQAEAHYLCALLNSAPVRCAAASYSQARGKSFGSPHLLANIGIPAFDQTDATHRALAGLGERAHADRGNDSDVAGLDVLAGKIWGLDAAMIQDVRRDLRELTGRAAQETA